MFRLNLLIVLLIASGCSSALPTYDRKGDESASLEAAERAARDAQSFAGEAKGQVDRSEALLREARELLARAELAQKNCATLVKRIPRAPKVETVVPDPAAAVAPTQGAGHSAAQGVAQSAPTTEAPKGGATKPEEAKPAPKPQYSPSDAPIH